MTGFVKTDTILDKILAHKVEENATWKQQRPMSKLLEMIAVMAPAVDFAAALRKDTVALIAEVKKASPSKGVLVEQFDPVEIASVYAQHGAAAISVLADEKFFQGNIRYIKQIRQAVNLPLLCKEFVIDPYQVYAARAFGADAVLLIAAALTDEQMRELHYLITQLGMTPLVEIHNEEELARVLKLDAKLIGINNRDLKTFNVDMQTTARLASLIPAEVTLVAESGIASVEDVQAMGAVGAHAVLVGESLVKAGDMAESVRAFSSQQRVS